MAGIITAEQQAILDETSKCLRDFNRKRSKILQKAFDEGGSDQVEAVLNWYEETRDAKFELLKKLLDANHHRYEELMKAGKDAALGLEKAIAKLNDTISVVNSMAGLVGVIGRIIITLGL